VLFAWTAICTDHENEPYGDDGVDRLHCNAPVGPVSCIHPPAGCLLDTRIERIVSTLVARPASALATKAASRAKTSLVATVDASCDLPGALVTLRFAIVSRSAFGGRATPEGANRREGGEKDNGTGNLHCVHPRDNELVSKIAFGPFPARGSASRAFLQRALRALRWLSRADLDCTPM